MRKTFLVVIILVTSFVTANSQNGINMSELIKVVDKADSKLMKSIVNKLNYYYLDSSSGENSQHYYFTKENKLFGAMLGWWTDAKYKVQDVTITLDTEAEADSLRSQVVKLGFKSSGMKKSKFSDSKSEDLEKGKLGVSYVIAKRKTGELYYEFTIWKLDY